MYFFEKIRKKDEDDQKKLWSREKMTSKIKLSNVNIKWR